MHTPTQLGFVSLQVRDLEAFRQFYTDVLGFQPMAQSSPDAGVFATPSGATFAIRKPLGDLQAATRLGWSMRLWCGADDPAALIQRLGGKASLLRGMQANPFGNGAMIADPDGYWPTVQKLPCA